jgi:hypothetical protein
LEFFENNEVLVGVVNLGITLLLGNQKADFFEPFQFSLDITGVFFNKLGQTPDMGFKVRVFGIDH